MKKKNHKHPSLPPLGSSSAVLEAPKIEFPCADYPIKVIGRNENDFRQFVLDFMQQYDAHIDLDNVTHHDSKSGKFRSIRFFMTAQSERQLMDMYKALKATGRVVTVI
ncbi:MAG: DUF493 family protein [Oceanospirillaceae bacterium]|nr:DUF493 family protein [Oceanospirillaceae bacterium]